MRRLFLLVLLPLVCQAGETAWDVTAEQWARPRSGDAILAMPPVREAVHQWMQAPHGTRLVIAYPGGEAGSLWADELRDWLISLGGPSRALELQPGLPEPDRLRLRLTTVMP